MTLTDIMALPVGDFAQTQSHLYLWVPNALLPQGIQTLEAWGFTYETNLVWYKIRKDGGPDRRGMSFYFCNVTELVLFGVRDGLRTLAPGRSQENLIESRKREHSRKPDELYDIIEQCSPGPYLDLFARRPLHPELLASRTQHRWTLWGNEIDAPEPPVEAFSDEGAPRT